MIARIASIQNFLSWPKRNLKTHQAYGTSQVNINLDRIKELTSERWLPIIKCEGTSLKQYRCLPGLHLALLQIDVKSHKFTEPGTLKDFYVHALGLWPEGLPLLGVMNLHMHLQIRSTSNKTGMKFIFPDQFKHTLSYFLSILRMAIALMRA